MKAASSNLRWSIAYWISRAGARLGRYFPARFWYFLAYPFAEACFLLMRGRRKTVTDNLRRVVGDEAAPRVAREVFHNFARYVIDFYQLPSLSRDALKRRIDFEDWQELNEVMSDGKGAIFVTLHLGQAELGGGALAAYGHPVSAIAETFDHTPMDEFIQGLRRDLGMRVIPANKAVLGVMRCLHRGEALAMMIDVVEPGEGIMVDFFGARTEFSTAPARLALRTKSRVMPGVIARGEQDERRFMPLIDFGLCYVDSGDEEADVRTITQAIATSLEGYVRRYPGQWFAFRPAWGAEEKPPASWRWKLLALNMAVRVGGLLPIRLSYGIAKHGADLAFRLRKGARADVLDNMRHVMGPDAAPDELEAAGREVFRNVARYYVDLVHLPHLDLSRQIGKDVRLHGFDILKSRLDCGQGAVVATAHFGNPELAVQVGAILGLDMLVLAEPLEPPAFAETMRRLRSAFGPRYEDVGFGAVADSIRHLRAGGCLAITCDRDIQRKGVPLTFFGKETRLPLGAVELATRTGAALIPAYCRRSGQGFDIVFEEPLPLVSTGNPREDALTNAHALLRRAETWIASDPGQWMVLERIWKPLPKQPSKTISLVSRAK